MASKVTKRGRNSSRSRLGCINCKQRHVRCDENYPHCGRCTRLQLGCRYLTPRRGRDGPPRTGPPRMLCPKPATSSPGPPSAGSSEGPQQINGSGHQVVSQQQAMRDWNRLGRDASQVPFFGDESAYVLQGLEWAWPGRSFADLSIASAEHGLPLDGEVWDWPAPAPAPAPAGGGGGVGQGGVSSDLPSRTPTIGEPSRPRPRPRPRSDTCSTVADGDGSAPLESRLVAFMRIRQPPAAMLMGGIPKWKKLQSYLLRLGSKDELVREALLCLEDVLSNQSTTGPRPPIAEKDPNDIASCFEAVKSRFTATISDSGYASPKEMLAALYLLAWAQVIRLKEPDVTDISLLRDQIDAVIVDSQCEWDWYSRELLSAFNSLDNKATHLGGCPILSPKALAVVSRYPIQITNCSYDESQEQSNEEPSSPHVHGSGAFVARRRSSVQLSTASVKEIVLRAVLQSGAEWYLRTQAYFRHISSLDKHQRPRFTPDDELEVSVCGKRIQRELEALWDECPSVISLSAEDLCRTLAPDVAARVQEVSSVYLASYWILFVYLHRVCWWHLPHTATVEKALAETWRHFQLCYCEESQLRTVHPALMWPVFIYAVETQDEAQQQWAVGQIKQLAIPRSVVESDSKTVDVLPALRLSQGVTQNASRAGALLEALIEKQRALGCRVDIRDLAVSIFGCYFSIV